MASLTRLISPIEPCISGDDTEGNAHFLPNPPSLPNLGRDDQSPQISLFLPQVQRLERTTSRGIRTRVDGPAGPHGQLAISWGL